MTNTTQPTPTVRAGLAVLIWKEGKVLMMRRKGSHAAGKYSIPGGHLEFGESWQDCATRETLEETGLHITNIRYLATTNDIMPDDNRHFITMWMQADWQSGEPQILEPEKAEDMGWHSLHDLPQPLFEPCWSNLRAIHPELFQPPTVEPHTV